MIGLDDRLHSGIADGQAADLAGGADVAFHQGGRDVQHFGHVVEAVAHIVGRQIGGRVHFDIEQIAHGVGVLDAIEAVQAPDGPDSGWQPPRRSSACSSDANEGIQRRPRPAGWRRLAASYRRVA